MRFLIDAHLPRGLCAILKTSGHEVVHTEDLPGKNATTDSMICEISARENRIVITKDTDFYHSHLLYRRPFKLVLVRTGNLRARILRELFSHHLKTIIAALEENDLIELRREGVVVTSQ